MSNSLELMDKKSQLVFRNMEILKNAKAELRELTDDENTEFKSNEDEIAKCDEELKALEEELEKETPNDEESKEDEERHLNTNKSNIRKMKYSLVKEIRNAMETGKSINLRGYDVATEGEDVVATDVYSVLEPLRAKNVLVQAGAKYITGLEGNVQVPVMTAGQVKWASEKGAAEDGSGTFTNVGLSPKRLTAKFPISLQFLAQTGDDVEAAIRADIINAINGKLEATILGADEGDNTKPAGLFAEYTKDDTKIEDFAGIADLEAEVEGANVYGDCKYIVSPKAKATLRSMIKGTNGTGMVMENGAIDGTTALATSHVPAGNLVYGDFTNLVIGAWDTVQLDVVRDTASLENGCVTIVVNAFFDAAVAREEAFVCANI